jgi:Family of unknown function (DUF6527)
MWRVTYWTKENGTLGRYCTDPYLWDTQESARARSSEYMDAGAASAGWAELYLKPDGTLCEFEDLGQGAFEVVEGPPGNFGLRFNLPGDHGNYIPIVKGPPTGTGHGPWGWDGNYDAPTITPSIWNKGYWHGFFTAGRFVSC